VEAWPQNLKTCVRIILTSRQPMFVWWGDSLINLYNDAYRSILGGKHPGGLGKPAAEVWKEVWGQIEPRATATMAGNEGTYDEALLFIMERNGYPEETYFTFSYSPMIKGERGASSAPTPMIPSAS
jgi:PAS domain-containing protein